MLRTLLQPTLVFLLPLKRTATANTPKVNTDFQSGSVCDEAILIGSFGVNAFK
jgi:hypothetical protein